MFRRPALSLLLALVSLSAGLWTSPAEATKNHLLMRAFKGESGGTTLVRNGPFLSWRPTGWTTCLIHEPNGSDRVDYSGSQPLPTAIDSKAVVGCDRRLEAGKQTVDFTRRNSPGFDKLARRLTNGDDQMLWNLSFLVDDNLTGYGMGGGACSESCPGWKQPAAQIGAKRGGPDLRGFKIDLIRLKVRDATWSTQPAADGYYLTRTWSFVWEIWGHKR